MELIIRHTNGDNLVNYDTLTNSSNYHAAQLEESSSSPVSFVASIKDNIFIEYNLVNLDDSKKPIIVQEESPLPQAPPSNKGYFDRIEFLKKSYSLKKEQIDILDAIVGVIIKLEKSSNTSFDLTFDLATDGEVIINRKTDSGIGIISIDNFGNIMVHFAGYHDKKRLNFYSPTDYDPESVVLGFLCS